MKSFRLVFCACALSALFAGCASAPGMLNMKDIDRNFPADAIVSAEKAEPVSFEELVEDLSRAKVVYVGERHTDPVHHQIQLKIIRALHGKHPDLSVGMEMFDHTYRPVLDQWSEGALDENEFVKRTHWYANWRYGFELYRDILLFVKDNKISLVGLNIPFHIPPKIAAGGVESLLEDDAEHLPDRIDTGVKAHREYLEKVFGEHSSTGLKDFETFYQAQCAWEDSMAEAVAERPGDGPMVVVVGNGHIVRKYGIPDRAHARREEPFKTVYLVPAGESAELEYADYIWVTPETEEHPMMGKMRR